MSINFEGYRHEADLKRDGSDNITTDIILVYTSTECADTAYQVLLQPEIPATDDPHPEIPDIYMNNLEIEVEYNGDEKRAFTVTASYGESSSGNETNTTNETVDFSEAFNFYEEAAEYVTNFDKAYAKYIPEIPTANSREAADAASKIPIYKSWEVEMAKKTVHSHPVFPVESTAQMPISATKTRTNLLVGFSYNIKKIQDYWITDFTDSVNVYNTVIAGIRIKAFTCRIKSLKFTQKEAKKNVAGALVHSFYYYQADVVLEIQNDGWGSRIANTSTYFKERFINDSGQEYLATTRIWEDSLNKYGSNVGTPDDVKRIGYGSRKRILYNLKQAKRSGDLSSEDYNEAKEGVTQITDGFPLTLDGKLSVLPNEDRVTWYLDYLDKKPAVWSSLNFPKKRRF